MLKYVRALETALPSPISAHIHTSIPTPCILLGEITLYKMGGGSSVATMGGTQDARRMIQNTSVEHQSTLSQFNKLLERRRTSQSGGSKSKRYSIAALSARRKDSRADAASSRRVSVREGAGIKRMDTLKKFEELGSIDQNETSISPGRMEELLEWMLRLEDNIARTEQIINVFRVIATKPLVLNAINMHILIFMGFLNSDFRCLKSLKRCLRRLLAE